MLCFVSEQVEEVKKILEKEHQPLEQGKVMYTECVGAGRRMSCGTAIVHLGNLSGLSVMSVDYSLFG